MDILSVPGNGLPAGTIQAQIVFQRGQECLINGGKDGRGYCFAAEIPVVDVAGMIVGVRAKISGYKDKLPPGCFLQRTCSL
jgi:hypothetical protein